MDDNKLRKISKKELLEILLEQAKRIEKLEIELTKTKAKLDSKRIVIEESGSIAEAALKLNDIFEVAQKTAEQYMINIKEKCKKIENDTKKECQIQKENMLKETLEKCQQREKEADEYIAKIELKVKELTKKKDNNSTDDSNGKKKIETKKDNNPKLNTTDKLTENNKVVDDKRKKKSKKGK